MRKVFFSVSAGVLALTMAACGSVGQQVRLRRRHHVQPAAAPAASAGSGCCRREHGCSGGGNGQTIGIAMPTKTSQRWIADGDNMVKQFTAAGYKTDLQYANNDIQGQVSQIENMITKGDKVLVIAAIDGTALTNTLADAAKAGIKVIAYDRLIRNSPNVDYYATFDNFKVGVLQASYIETALGLKDGKGPFNIELFAGSPDDNNATFFFNGAMSILQPYITSGKLVVKSRPDRVPEGRDPALGRRRGAVPHGQHPEPLLHQRQRRRGALAVRRPEPRHHRRAAERRLRPTRSSSPVRTPRSSRSSSSSRAPRPRPSTRTPACSPSRPS